MNWTKLGLAAAVAFPFAWASPAAFANDDAILGERLVDVMNQLFGQHPGLRPMHTKGLVVEGTFTPSGAGAALSKAALFQGATTPITARFSDATGLPAIPDGDPNANPHGLGIRFHLADDGEMDVVTNSLKFFPVATGEEFLGLLQAVAASGPDAAKPTSLESFVATHPTVPRAFASTSTPASYARETYNGVNAFVFVDAAGQRHPFRFRLVPVAGEEHLSAGDAARQAPDFLFDDLRAALAQGPVRFRLMAQLARPGDPTADPSQPWPDDRELVDLGEIALTRPAADNAAAEKDLMLLPGNLADGIEPSDDPMIAVRDETYAVSFSRRSQ
jgi:catalase